jgi:hypothetical protein
MCQKESQVSYQLYLFFQLFFEVHIPIDKEEAEVYKLSYSLKLA